MRQYEFEVVDKSLFVRTPKKGTIPPALAALMKGEVVFFPGREHTNTPYKNRLNTEGYRVSAHVGQHGGQRGLFVLAERKGE